MGLALAFGLSAAGCAMVDEPEGMSPRPGARALSSIKEPAPRQVATGPRPKLAADKATPAAKSAEAKVADRAADKPTDTRLTVASLPSTPAAQPTHETACINVEQCASVLKAMVDDPDRAWIGRPANAVTLANGVRLFAYRALRPRLSCNELTTAFHEVSIGMATFAGPVTGLKPEQVERARILSTQVEAELSTERAQRCQATGQAIDIRQGALPNLDAARELR